jgi:tetratricopeptide (TPR) repeat protein
MNAPVKLSAVSAAHPFPGLRPFAYQDRDFFFGRQDQIYALYRRIDRFRFIAVVGSSGSGKSSLVRAGLLPLLDVETREAGGRNWVSREMRPGDAPLSRLTDLLVSLSVDDDPMVSSGRRDRIAAQLRRSSFGISEALAETSSVAGKSLVLVIDQFEELFRYAAGSSDKTSLTAEEVRARDEATQFVQLLLESSHSPSNKTRVLLTMRSDFIGDCARFHGLPEAVCEAQFLTPSLTRDQLDEVIRKPIEKAGATIDPQLVERLLNDCGTEMDQLPVLQHCLSRLWEEAGRTLTANVKSSVTPQFGGEASNIEQPVRRITLDHYRKIGQFADALSMHADEILKDLPGPKLQLAVGQIFSALSELDKGGRATRRALKFSQLVAETGLDDATVRQVLDRFRASDCSFLTPPPFEVKVISDNTRIDVGHEALLRRWDKVSGRGAELGWLRAEQQAGERYRGLLAMAEGKDAVLPAHLFEERWAWWNAQPRTPAWADRYGGGYSRVESLLLKSRRRKRLRRLAVAALFVAALGVAGDMFRLWQNAKIQADRAQQALTTATGIANTLVFDLAQDSEGGAVPHISPSRTTLSGVAPRVTALPRDLTDWLFNRAIVSYTQLIELNRSSEAYNGRAAAYYNKADFDHAIADYDQAIILDSKNGSAYYNRGLAYHAKGNPDQAIDDYGRAIALNGNNTMAFRSRGLAYHDKGAFDRAISDYEQAITLDSKNSVAYLYRALAYHAKHDSDRAIADFDQAIMLDQNGWRAYYGRGVAYELKDNFDRAIADYSQAITVEPKSTYALHDRGNIYFKQGKLDDAIADFDRVIELLPRVAGLYELRGQIYTHKSDFDQAVADFNQAIALDPKNAFSYQLRGMIALYAGALPKALDDLNKASEVDPKLSYAAIWLDIVNKRSNLPSRLAQAATLIDMTKWPAPVIRLYLGELTPTDVLAAADDPKPDIKRAQVCEANLFIGELALQQGKNEEAARLFRLAAGDCPPNFVEWYAARAELKALGEDR